MRTITLLLTLVSLSLANLAQAQGPQIGIVPPPGKLHVRIQGEPGTMFSYLVAPNAWKLNTLPCDLTLQPGARYLFKVENMPHCPGITFYPTLEVVDVLYLPQKLKASDHPAPIFLTEQDGLTSWRGSMITKVITLEDPEGPFVGIGGNVNGGETEPLAGNEVMTFAKEVGRPLAILRWGNKEPTADDLSGKSLNTGGPVCGPIVPVKPFKIGEECLRDGGDFHSPAHFNNGKLKGLEPSDTVMTYSDRVGRKIILPSNPVCLCVPRFVTLRQVTQLEGIALHEAANRVALASPAIILAKQDKAVPTKQLEEGIILKRNAKAQVDIVADRAIAVKQVEGVRIIAMLEKPKEQIGVELPEPPCCDEPLEVCKSCSVQKAQIGDVVSFTIKFANKSCQAIHDVAISDSLSARFEYVPGTAKCSREAVFVTTTNEVGSLVLRWEMKDPVPAKQGGEVTFQVRVK